MVSKAQLDDQIREQMDLIHILATSPSPPITNDLLTSFPVAPIPNVIICTKRIISIW